MLIVRLIVGIDVGWVVSWFIDTVYVICGIAFVLVSVDIDVLIQFHSWLVVVSVTTMLVC